MSKRLAGRFGYPADKPFAVTLHPDKLDQPTHWRKPRRIFVCSMGDLFHEDVPDEFIWKVFHEATFGNRRHTYLFLTKRPERMRRWFRENQERFWNFKPGPYVSVPWPDPQLWLGITAENQEQADKRIPILLDTPAAVRFVSCEPLLGPVDLTPWVSPPSLYDLPNYQAGPGQPVYEVFEDDESVWYPPVRLDWCIVGGETGPGARPMHPEWVRSLRDQCQAAGVAFWFKAWGKWLPALESPASDWKPITRADAVERIHLWPDEEVSFRVGKKAAGHLLDGREWHEGPTP